MADLITGFRLARIRLVSCVLAAGIAACSGDGAPNAESAQEEPAPAASSEIRVGGFSTPESVLHDPGDDFYLVSNINGQPLDEDGNGFISRVTPDGEVADLRWIDGQDDDVTLNAPKGMAILGGTLYVADIDCVRKFDVTTGAPDGEICVEGATFLNDIAAGPNGELFVTDMGFRAGENGFEPSGTMAIHRMSPDGRQAPIIEGDQLGGPNGLAVGPRGLFMVSFGSGQIFQVGMAGELTPVTQPSERQLDGIVFAADGGFVFSSWGEPGVFHVSAEGTQRLIGSYEAPADIGYDAQRNRVLIPLFLSNEVVIVDLE